ncbi:Hsp20/alpha crystallin family protein [Isosphaeraceae bacterium EP7]
MSRLNSQGRWDPFREIQREVSRIIETFEVPTAWGSPRPFPPVNLYDAGTHYLLTAQLAGVASDDLDLSITGDTLILCGERKRSSGASEEHYRRQERPVGRWSRTITLPDRVEASAVSAAFSSGILTITLPKSEGSLPRQIRISSASEDIPNQGVGQSHEDSHEAGHLA